MFNQRVHTRARKKSPYPIRLLYIVNSFFSFSYSITCSAFSLFLDYLRSVTVSDSFFIFVFVPLLFLISSFCLFFSFFSFFLFWTIRSVSCPFPYYFASHFCFPNSLMIFLINRKINNKHNIYYGSLDPSSFPNP